VFQFPVLSQEWVVKPLMGLNEEQLRANRFQLVSQLADDLAHELKNPLNAIVINLEVLKVRAAKGDAQAASERVGVIEHEVRRLHHLMDRLLLLLRPDREEYGALALDQVLDEVLPLIEAQARLSRNEMTVDPPPPVFVGIRRDVLKFALLNVLTATHARLGDGGGTLRITCEPSNSHVRVDVRAQPSPDAHVAPADADFQHACDVAEALLLAGGGSLEPGAAGATLVIPRVVPL
jgi:signal transduction histidine kinase